MASLQHGSASPGYRILKVGEVTYVVEDIEVISLASVPTRGGLGGFVGELHDERQDARTFNDTVQQGRSLARLRRGIELKRKMLKGTKGEE